MDLHGLSGIYQNGHLVLNDQSLTLMGAGISLIVGIVLVVSYRHGRELLDEIWAVDTYQAQELGRMCSGGFDAMVEVEGTITCDDPVRAPVSKLPCVWCHTTIEREQPEVRQGPGDRLYMRFGIGGRWRKVLDRTIGTVFKVNDETGYTLVDPTQADVDGETICDEIMDGPPPGFVLDWAHYRVREVALLPQGHVYVLGQASAFGDDARVHFPTKGYLDPKERNFAISRQSEKEIVESGYQMARLYLWLGVGAFVLSAVCFLCVLDVLP